MEFTTSDVRHPYTNLNDAYDVAVSAATDDLPDAQGVTSPRKRRRWSRQLSWDRANMRTASCRLPKYDAERLARCCREAGISQHRLIKYMLYTWMAAWENTGVAMYGKQ